jgi:hypothetical protein
VRYFTPATLTGRVVMLCAIALSVVGTGIRVCAKDTAKVESGANAAGWLSYHNAATGLLFRYPPSLRINERDPQSFGLPDVEEITDLLGDTTLNPGTIALRFIVWRGERTPEMAAAKARDEREKHARPDWDSRESLTTIQLDGHEALVSVGCGRAACHWAVNILQPRDCAIFTMISDPIEDTYLPPHDGTFPLLSIIKTVRLERVPKATE